MDDNTFFWYNFQTKRLDAISGIPDDLSQYIPKIEAAQMLFQLYQLAGDTPIDAYTKVMERIVAAPHGAEE